MIATQDSSPQLTPEEYFAWEEQQLEKHEYIDGQVYALFRNDRSGGSKNHSLIGRASVKSGISGEIIP